VKLGVSATKDEVHAAIRGLPAGVLDTAFCRVNEDVFGGDPDYCVVSHADGAGTKSILAYLDYRTTGSPDAFRGIAQDAVVMNLDDMLCAGATEGFTVASIVNRNARRVDGRALQALVEGTQAFAERMTRFGVRMAVAGGETADVGDVVKTVLVDAVLTCRMPRRRLVANAVRPGDVVVAFASGGEPAVYEDGWNSGIGCNGITAARHGLLNHTVAERFPEVFDDALDPALVYRGPFGLIDELPGTGHTVLRALLSPTRTFAPIVRAVLEEHRDAVSGIVHCTGGGQTKCLRFGDRVRYVKELRDIPPLFQTLHRHVGGSWLELATIFNLGYRMELYCREAAAEKVIAAARHFGVRAAVIGHVERSGSDRNELALTVAGERHVQSMERPSVTTGAARP
jgi:phosphoribosylformylglycinamidine cyclo-ligase